MLPHSMNHNALDSSPVDIWGRTARMKNNASSKAPEQAVAKIAKISRVEMVLAL